MLDTRIRLLEVASDLLGVASKTGFLTYINPVWQSLLGFTEKELTAQPYLKLVHPDDFKETVTAMTRVIESGVSAKFENRCIAKDGTCRSINWQVSMSPERAELLFAGHDITDYRQIEKMRAWLTQNEEAILSTAHTWNSRQIQDILLSAMSHKLQTPLHAVIGWAQALQSQTLSDEERLAGLQMIKRSAKYQLGLIEELLLAASLFQGQLSLPRVPMNLVDVVSAAVEVTAPMAKEKEIAIHTESWSDTFDTDGNPMRLRQAISYLLSNAIQFTPENGTVSIVLFSKGQQAYVQITDTGIGISADLLPHILEHFQYLSSLTTQSFDEVGLGLMISQHLVRMHDGEISVESPGIGQGTTVTIKLPLV